MADDAAKVGPAESASKCVLFESATFWDAKFVIQQ